ncbi:MAG TPA: NAD-dependent epimerase/dehydratase family protein [Thermoleophilaceae bacterium]
MRYLITGGSGYIGSRLVDLLARREDTEKIVIADVVPPKGGYRPKTEYEKVDVRDRGAVHAALQRGNPDVLMHLAFILNPVHNEAFMYDVDVNGTHNVLEAAAEVGIGQVLVTTSGVAYGAFPDNPDPITEDWPVRGVPRFSYARDKTDSDRIVQLWAHQHPDVVTTIVRPCIVYGPNVDNYLVRLWSDAPAVADVGNIDRSTQFVHEDDVVEAISRLLLGKHAGQFNLAADGLMTRRECAELLDTRVIKMPLWLYRTLAKLAWHLRQSEAPAGGIDFELYSWILSNEKVKKTLDWTPRYSSRQTFLIAMRAKGKLPPADEAPAAAASTPELSSATR